MTPRADVTCPSRRRRPACSRCAGPDRRRAPPSARTAPPAAACARSRRTPRSPPCRPPRAAPCGPRSRSTARRAPRSARRAARLSSGAPAKCGPAAGQAAASNSRDAARRSSGSVAPSSPSAPAQRQHQLLLHPAAAHRQVAVRARGLRAARARAPDRRSSSRSGSASWPSRPCASARSPRSNSAVRTRCRSAGVLRQPLDHDVGRARERGGGVGDALVGVDEAGRARLGRLAGRGRPRRAPHAQSQSASGSSPASRAVCGLRLPLLLVGEVDVLEQRLVERRADARLQLRRQLPLALDLLDDERLALDELVPALLGLEHLPDRHLVQVPGLLLAVARDERHGRAALREGQDRLRAGERNLAGVAPRTRRETSPSTCRRPG